MRVLFANHTGAWSGAEVALMRLVAGLRLHEGVEAAVACPPRGPLPEAVDAAGICRLALPDVRANFAFGPVRTPRALAELTRAGVALRRAAGSWRPDLIHANSVRAGLSGAVAARLGAPPLVVQAHEHLPDSLAGRVIRSTLARNAAALTAVTDHGAANLDADRPAGRRSPRAHRIHIAIDQRRFDPARVDPARTRDELGVPPRAALLAMVAQITPWKGHDTAIRALAEIRRARPDARLALIGHVAFSFSRYDNVGYERSLHELVGELGLEDSVLFLGQRSDVPALLAAADLSLLPSWDEPFGTAAAESMAMGTPALVTAVGGVKEYVDDGVTGRVLAPRAPGAWAAAVLELLAEPERLRAMGERARATAERFTDERYAAEMMRLYRAVLRGAG